jgi:chromosome segregation ATPase
MSDRDTIQPPSADHPTEPDHEVPTMPPEFDPEQSDAPQWAKDLLHRMGAIQEGIAQIRQEHAETVRDWSQWTQQVLANQELTINEVRTLCNRVETIERRLGIGEERFKTIEGRITRIEQRLDELEAQRGRA